MAVCVCDADGAHSEAERGFLADLRASLGLDAAGWRPVHRGGAGDRGGAAGRGRRAAAPGGGPDPAERLDQAILNAAILNGALELLPETLSTMAIIPLQMKLVYRIGKAYGFELDSGHIKDFIATVGVGLTSQYLEQAGRKLLGGLLGKVGGGLLGGLGKQAVSSGMSFATTCAGPCRRSATTRSGRQLSTADAEGRLLRSVMQEAQGLQTRYLPAMQEKARTLDARQVLSMVRGPDVRGRTTGVVFAPQNFHQGRAAGSDSAAAAGAAGWRAGARRHSTSQRVGDAEGLAVATRGPGAPTHGEAHEFFVVDVGQLRRGRHARTHGRRRRTALFAGYMGTIIAHLLPVSDQ